MKLRFNLTFKSGPRTVAQVTGGERYDESMSMEELYKLVIEVEQKLEKLTGYRVHVECEQVR